MPTAESKECGEIIKQKVTNEYILTENTKYVSTLDREVPEIFRDILPNFAPLAFMIAVHAFYILYGNIVIIPWLVYLFRPYFNRSGINNDSYNISKKHERNFM